jgi:hypothetical protein
MKPTCKFESQGFATISLLLFLPLIGLMLFSFGFSGYLIQHKTKIRSTCLKEGRRIQENLARNEEAVIKLNPIASALRLQLKLAYVELTAAVASENPIWVAEVHAKIIKIKNHQKQLDSLQKSLLAKTKFDIAIQVAFLQNQLNQIDQTTSQIWKYYLDIFAFSIVNHLPEVALEPDSPDVAPVYELAKNHESRQSLAFQWQTYFRTKASAQKLLSAADEVDFLCRVSAQKEGKKWSLLINAGKS